VGRTGNDLQYRGYDILDVAESCEFEEIAYLLITQAAHARRAGRLPQEAPRIARTAAALCAVLELLPASAHPMDVLRTTVSALAACCPRGRAR